MAYQFNAVGAVTQLTTDDNNYALAEYAITVVNSGVVSFEIAFDPVTDFPYISYQPLASTDPIVIEVPFTDIWTKGSVAVQSNGNIVYGLVSDPSTGPSKVISVVITPAGGYTIKSATIGTGDETVTGVSSTGVIRVQDSVKGTLYVKAADLTATAGSGVSFTPIATTTDPAVSVSIDPATNELKWTTGGTTSVFAKVDSDTSVHYTVLGSVADTNSIGAIVSDGTNISYFRSFTKLFTATSDTVVFDFYTPGNSLAGLSNSLGGDDYVFLPSDLAAWGLTGGFHGGDGNDQLVAGSTGMKLWGDAGSDKVIGGAGNDILYGGSSSADDFAPDVLSGNGGVNIFYVGSDDTVTDASAGDKIILPASAVTLTPRRFDGSFDVSFQQTKNGTVQTSVVHVQSNHFVRLVPSTVGNETTLTVVASVAAPAQSWDFNGDGLTDILFQSPSGQYSNWQVNGTSVIGGGNLTGATSGRLVGMGDFDGNGYSDGLFVRPDGSVGTWLLYNSNLPGGATIGNAGPAFTALAAGDYNGDHRSEILFRNNQNGTFAFWKLTNGTSLAGGGAIANPGVEWAYKATADFNGDGTSDILFQRTDGLYGVWMITNGAVSGGGAIGNPGPSWFFKDVGDFNGDGKADLLFENVNGTYATWNLDGNTILGGGLIDKAASTATLVGVGDYNGDEKSDLLFRGQDGTLSTVTLDDHTVTGGGSLGNPGATNVAKVHGASNFETLVFQSASTSAVSTWTFGTGIVVTSGAVGNAGTGWTGIATGDFSGTGQTDLLQTDGAGHYRTWAINGSTMLGSTVVGTVNNNTFLGVGDFNGDGRTDILFQNPDNGVYYNWTMNGGTILNVGIIGSSPGFAFAGLADFNGDGKSDILFKSTTTGDYASWSMDGNAIVGGGLIGNPGSAWSLKGTGDFNGDGKADMLFLNTNGTYAIWDLNGNAITGGGAVGDPGAGWTLAKIADLNQDGKDDLVFVNGSGDYASWLLNNNTIVGGGLVGHATGLHII